MSRARRQRAEPMPILRAMAVAVEEDEETGTFIVAFAEEPDGGGRMFMIQQSLAPYDEQDRRLGMDTHCLCDENALVQYGGIDYWELSPPGSLVLRLKDGADDFGADDDGYLRIEFAAEKFAEVKRGLERVFELERRHHQEYEP